MFLTNLFSSSEFSGGDDFWYTPTGVKTASGVRVTHETSLRYSAVFACIRVLSETVASLPLNVYRRFPDGNKEELPNHPLYNLLHNEPNNYQTSFEFREMMMGHVGLRGNAYAIIQSNAMGIITGLIPLHAERVTPKWNDRGVIIYDVKNADGATDSFLQNEIFHLRGLSSDGLTGLSPIEHHRETIGMGLAAQEYGARLFANDATPRGVLEHPSHFKDDESFDRFRRSWRDQQTGAKRHSTAVLEDGIKYNEIGMSNEDAQFLETRKYQVNEVARIFRIPPHMIGDLEKATFSNIEYQSIDFVVHTIRPWLVRWEQAIKRVMITEPDVFVEFKVDALLRGDIKSRYESYALAINSRWLLPNEVRKMENRNPIDGLDEMQPVDMPANKNNDLTNSAASIIVNKEEKLLQKNASNKNKFIKLLGNHAQFISDVMQVSLNIAELAVADLKIMFSEETELKDFATQRTQRLIKIVKGL